MASNAINMTRGTSPAGGAPFDLSVTANTVISSNAVPINSLNQQMPEMKEI